MIEHLRLERFKNFRQAELSLGGLTLLVGTNASGKSNLRDAFRFLHGIGRGYSLAEILGEKYGEGGELQWRGIRGGGREIATYGESSFALETMIKDECQLTHGMRHAIEVNVANRSRGARVTHESLVFDTFTSLGSKTSSRSLSLVDPSLIYRTFSIGQSPSIDPEYSIEVLVQSDETKKGNQLLTFDNEQPILSQFEHRVNNGIRTSTGVSGMRSQLDSMRFFDFSSDAMRLPSLAGQVILGDRGENLSSVLKNICEAPEKRRAVMEWLRELTPLDVVGFDFAEDVTGKVLVLLVEANGDKTSAYSASDGTLRFLGMIAAFMGPKPAQFYFIEEIDNGIHPTRLPLLLELIEKHVADGRIQVVATTHSPQLLGLLSEDSFRNAALVYRLSGAGEAHIRKIVEIPEAERVLAEQDLSRLHSSGWLEDAVAFMEGSEVTP